MTNQENQVKDLATRRPLEIKRKPLVPDVPKTRLIIRQRTRFGQAEVKRDISLFATTLTISLALSCLVALVVVWGTWVMVPPEQAARIEGAPWTNRVGLILAIAWPIQCGLGLVVLS